MGQNPREISSIKIWFDEGRIWLISESGREMWQSLLYYKRLLHATEAQRNNYELTSFGIHWPDLDEDVSFESFEYPNPEPSEISRVFLMHPEINASAVARRLGMKQSLLASYINGTKRPSPQRKEKIIGELHRIGAELLEL